MKSETVLGAFIAAIIGGMTAFLALMNQDTVVDINDISPKAWIVLFVGTMLAFFKDYQAITTRRALKAITGSGNIHSHWTTGLLAIVLAGSVLIAGCTGTRSAYQEADGPDQTAKVVAEHYFALVKEANELKKSGALSGDALAAAQALVKATEPTIDHLIEAVGSYESVQSAQTEADLDAAIAEAITAVSRLLDIVEGAKTSGSLDSEQAPPDDDTVPLWDEADDEPLKKAA